MSPLQDAPPSVSERLALKTVALKSWGSLDRSSDWEGFTAAASQFEAAVSAFDPTIVVFVDWTAAALARKLVEGLVGVERRHDEKSGHAPGPKRRPRLVYLNFRVFAANKAAGSNGEDREFYASQEGEAVRQSDVTVALSPGDAWVLDALARAPTTGPDAPKQLWTRVLNPPLRSDLRALTAPLDFAPTAPRRWLLCCSRLSPEKNVASFIEVVNALGPGQLRRLGVVPRLVGSGPLAPELRAALLAACPFAVVSDFDGDPKNLAELFAQTALNFHPALYEAYGMTVLEAAAFGAPSVIDSGGGVGVASRLRPAFGEAFLAPLAKATPGDATGIAEVAGAVAAILMAPDALAATGAKARARAIDWDLESFGRELSRSVLGRDEFAAEK